MMKRNLFALLRTFVFAALVPVMSLSLVSCEPENGDEGGGTTPGVTPEVSVPDGYVNYFIEDLSFSRSAGEVKVAFQINVDWSMKVVAPEGTSSSWLSVDPASGDAGLHKIMIRVTENDVAEVRTATIQLMSGKSKVAEILVTQEEAFKYEAVDLGLSVKWASCNVGAESPEGYGDYFAWGETTTKSSYTSNNSVTYGLSISKLESRGIIGSDGNLTAAYDAATANWGDNWRMPTSDEMQELIDKCTWEWTAVNGVNGRLVTGPNGNSIFLPAAGYRYNTSLYRAGSIGDYWSATPYSSSYIAYYLLFNSDDYDWYGDSRDYGQAVRPVSEK